MPSVYEQAVPCEHPLDQFRCASAERDLCKVVATFGDGEYAMMVKPIQDIDSWYECSVLIAMLSFYVRGERKCLVVAVKTGSSRLLDCILGVLGVEPVIVEHQSLYDYVSKHEDVRVCTKVKEFASLRVNSLRRNYRAWANTCEPAPYDDYAETARGGCERCIRNMIEIAIDDAAKSGTVSIWPDDPLRSLHEKKTKTAVSATGSSTACVML
eukprot:TRINITY_DN3333_c0_g1_i1.p1 TRINITY_DN3333_c0_g1~~TRINITY_DN3333_c0_g1_i1.p1  ORF type:complete len:226 (-),score=0.74 TRINITY_DN3333_c0_g1_i1:467-1102(-)